mgnify:CR=1 FL=1
MSRSIFLPQLFFVVIITTPLAAREPYSAVAEAPFKIVTDSTSSELISLAALPKSVVELSSVGLPRKVELS